MFSSTQFDGGFSSSQFVSTQDIYSPDSAASKPRSATHGPLPVTVKQIRDAHDASDDKSTTVIDGTEATNVRLVGQVVSKRERATDVTFSLDDGTGRIDVKKWTTDAGDNKQAALIQNGTYVVVNGSLKEFQGNKHVNAFDIRIIVDYNEIALHFIQCIHVHLHNTGHKVGSPGPAQSSPLTKTPLQNEVNGYHTPVSNKSSVQTKYVGTEDINKLVMDVFEEPESISRDHGVHIDELVRKLGIPTNKIKDAINYLVDAGRIYSTIDDFHYKAAGNN